MRVLAAVVVLLAACDKKEPAKEPTPVERLTAACDRQDWEACRNLGVLHSEGAAVARDEAKAIALFTRACDGGNGAACNNLGLVEPARAGERFGRACELGSLLGCRNHGLFLAPTDRAAAVAAFTRACDGGLPFACTNLALVRSEERDDDAAAKLLQRACDGGDPIGCRYLGVAYLEGRGLPRGTAPAKVWLEMACARGDRPACDLIKTLP